MRLSTEKLAELGKPLKHLAGEHHKDSPVGAALRAYTLAIEHADRAHEDALRALSARALLQGDIQPMLYLDATGQAPLLSIGSHKECLYGVDDPALLPQAWVLTSGVEVVGEEYDAQGVVYQGSWTYRDNTTNRPSRGRGVEIVDGRKGDHPLTFIRVGEFRLLNDRASLKTGCLFVVPGAGIMPGREVLLAPEHVHLPNETAVRFVHNGNRV